MNKDAKTMEFEIKKNSVVQYPYGMKMRFKYMLMIQDNTDLVHCGLQMRDKSFTTRPLMGEANTFINKWSGMYMLTQELKSE
jgi:hypothetical protein